ncbi:MAG: pectate lyase [Phenylobacterium sp.]|uniref:pectate lyase family protein n=1 Tax=Phenylobacterium sp. TaxID=1871053 RepID=UPI001B6EF5A1|nr:pectate lyase [Phenylobacterium sp.]MBP7814645.1 pectate lyase [Phenylobacterium sp.]MBP9231321.1 pectate lyase [Phenylobacterium sp.]
MGIRLAAAVLFSILLAGGAVQAAEPLAFPGAQGWAASTPGGRGGRIIRVTTLASEGPGSLREAVEAKGPRIVVFEVGGVIDLDRKTLRISEPFLTIAGQTAPSPGITLIRGGMDVSAHDVVMQHIRVRPGEAGQPKKSGWDEDGFSTVSGAYNIIVDHCTFTWATDENLSVSGLRFVGQTPDDWRAATSHRITYSNNIIAESLAYSTHAKIEHSKGSLIHDNASDLLIVGNLYAHNYERNALFKGGVRAVMANNLIYNPGQRALHYNLQANEWGDHPYQTGQISAVGNVLRAGISTPDQLAFFELGGDGDVAYHARDNIAVDRIGRPLPMLGRYTTSRARIIETRTPPTWPPGFTPMAAADVQKSVLMNVGARPWDRDFDDVRLLADVAEGRGTIIDSEQALHGYPVQKPTARPFNEADWNLADMTPKRPEVLDSGAKAKGT